MINFWFLYTSQMPLDNLGCNGSNNHCIIVQEEAQCTQNEGQHRQSYYLFNCRKVIPAPTQVWRASLGWMKREALDLVGARACASSDRP